MGGKPQVLINKVNFEKLTENDRQCVVQSYTSPLTCEQFRLISLPPSWEVIIDVNTEHKYFINIQTQTILQYFKCVVCYMEFDSTSAFWARVNEFIATRSEIKAAQYMAVNK